MELAASSSEILKALSDLPIGIICIPFFIILIGERFKDGERTRTWIAIFVTLMLAAFLGSSVHALAMGDMTLRIMWVILYLLMFLVIYFFYVLIYEIFKEEKMGSMHRKLFMGFALAMYLAAAGIRLATGNNMIAIFAAFAFLVVIQMGIIIMSAGTQKKEAKLLKESVGILIMALLCQGAAFIFPEFNGASAAHIFILIAMFVIFMAAREDCSKRKQTK